MTPSQIQKSPLLSSGHRQRDNGLNAQRHQETKTSVRSIGREVVSPAPVRAPIRRRTRATQEVAYGEKCGKGVKLIMPLIAANQRQVNSFYAHLNAGGLRPKSLDNATHAVRQFLSYCQHHGYPTALDIQGHHIEEWLVSLKGYSIATVHNRYKGVHAFYKFLAHPQRGLMEHNPMDIVSMPKGDKNHKPVASRE